jgi:hypothetical protein
VGVTRAPARGVDDEFETAAADGVRGSLQQLGGERFQVGDQDADHVGLVVAQALRDQARLVAHLADHGLDVRAGRRRHAVPGVEDLGDRRDRDTGRGGDVTDRDSRGGLHEGTITSDNVIDND